MSHSSEADETLYEQWVERNALAKAAARRKFDPSKAAIAAAQKVAASHRATAAFYGRMALEETEARPRRTHIANAKHYVQLAREAEARAARAAPVNLQRVHVPPRGD